MRPGGAPLRRPHWKTGQPQLIFEAEGRPPLEFLARLLQHVPPKGHKLWREYGAYSTVTRARWRKLAEAETAKSENDDDPAPPPSPAETPGRKQCTSAWAALLSRVWGFDPLECPHCPFPAGAPRWRPRRSFTTLTPCPLPAGTHHYPPRPDRRTAGHRGTRVEASPGAAPLGPGRGAGPGARLRRGARRRGLVHRPPIR